MKKSQLNRFNKSKKLRVFRKILTQFGNYTTLTHPIFAFLFSIPIYQISLFAENGTNYTNHEKQSRHLLDKMPVLTQYIHDSMD